jgi:hypothetical protein
MFFFCNAKLNSTSLIDRVSFHNSVNGAVCGRLYYIYSELPRDVRGVVTIETFVTFFKIRQVRTDVLYSIAVL